MSVNERADSERRGPDGDGREPESQTIEFFFLFRHVVFKLKGKKR